MKAHNHAFCDNIKREYINNLKVVEKQHLVQKHDENSKVDKRNV